MIASLALRTAAAEFPETALETLKAWNVLRTF
jgi:hypothetical protein